MYKVIRSLSSYSQHCLHLFNSYHIRIIVKQSNHSIPIFFISALRELSTPHQWSDFLPAGSFSSHREFTAS